jgi:hypothetical protein
MPLDISPARARGKQAEMAETTITFDDGAAYDSFMGRWSRPVGVTFLKWVAAQSREVARRRLRDGGIHKVGAR